MIGDPIPSMRPSSQIGTLWGETFFTLLPNGEGGKGYEKTSAFMSSRKSDEENRLAVR